VQNKILYAYLFLDSYNSLNILNDRNEIYHYYKYKKNHLLQLKILLITLKIF